MCHVSKDLYNQALYEIKREYAASGMILSYQELDRRLKQMVNLEGEINYRLLPAQVAQQTLRQLASNVNAFFKALADYKRHPEKYYAMPRFPRFLPKNGYFVAMFTNQKATVTAQGIIKLTRHLAIEIPSQEFSKHRNYWISEENGQIKPLFAQVRIVPKFGGRCLQVEIVYDQAATGQSQASARAAAVDLGVNNLVALVDSEMGAEGRMPMLINGRPLKSINQYYNKQRARLQSEQSCTAAANSNRLWQVVVWRHDHLKDYFHKASRWIVRHCVTHGIGQLVIGHNPDWKQSVAIGRRNNQNFVQIPFAWLIAQLSYKAAMAGITVTILPESYTSKCSALDLEPIAKHEDHAYAGRRVKRGLFRTSTGLLLNADVNGALNILRKAIGDRFLKPFIQNVARLTPSSGYLCYPIKVCL